MRNLEDFEAIDGAPCLVVASGESCSVLPANAARRKAPESELKAQNPCVGRALTWPAA